MVQEKSKKALVTRIYTSQVGSSKNRGHALPSYSKKDLRDWLDSQPLFHELYDSWVLSDHEKGLKPSVDRKEDADGYTLANIELMTWNENKAKQHRNRSEGVLNMGGSACKIIDVYTSDFELVGTYHSIIAAASAIGVLRTGVSAAINGRQKTCKGYIVKERVV